MDTSTQSVENLRERTEFRLVAFDFDGTLADSADWFHKTLSQMADEFGFKRLDECGGKELRKKHALEVLRHLGVPLWKLPRIMKRVRELSARDADSIRLFPGVDEMLRDLKKAGALVAMVSSNSEEAIRRVLGPENSARIDYFRCGASLFGKRIKLTRLAREAGIKPSEVLYVGDEIRDLVAAREAGMAFGGVAWGYTDAGALEAEGPDRFFREVREISQSGVR